MSTYVFDPSWQKEHDRLSALGSVFDAASRRHLEERGVTRGWQCLEVGCGAGSLALWLAEQVGSTGLVLATDVDTRFIDGSSYENLEIREHNILTDPLPKDAFDLAHARAVIEHIADHQGALGRIISAVRPGGWVVVEDLDFGGAMTAALPRYFWPAENIVPAERVYRALDALFSSVGADASYGPRLPGALKEAGLENVGAEAHTHVVAGGSENWARGSIEQLGKHLEATGPLTAEEVELSLAMMADEASLYPVPFMVTAWGQRPIG